MNNNTEQHWWNDIGNWFIKIFNQGIYFLLAGLYDIIINISKSQILSGSTVMAFFSRVQLMIGVFMIFRLTITVLQGLVDPEKFMDSKSGFGSVIMKIVISLALLTTLIPINIPEPSNSYEKQIKSNGLLFGILYDFQDRILSRNILAKLVLGTNDASDSDSRIKDAGDNLSSMLLKNFFTPNLKPEIGGSFKMIKGDDGILRYSQEDLFCETRVEADGGNEGNDDPKQTADAYEKYYKSENPVEILNLINERCETTTDPSGKKYIKLMGWDAYAFNFNWLIALVCGAIFLFVLVNICIEVAKRAIKIAILRLIAPIPIISYMNPKSSMDNGSFGSWVKTLSSTYIDLFINLLIIYFVLFLMNEIANNNGLIVSDGASGTVVLFSKVFIYIGLLLFAKDAPKFIKQALGMKDEGGKGWFSGIAAAAGLGAAGLGAIGSARTNYRAAKEENAKLHPYEDGRNFFRNVGSGLIGGMSGMVTGGKAALTAKDHNFKAARDAISTRNAQRAAHSTALGRAASTAYGLVSGQGLAERENKKLKANQEAFNTFKDYKGIIEDEALKKTDFYGTDKSGRSYNYNKLAVALERARSSGAATFDYNDGINNYTGLSTDSFDSNVMNDIKSSQAQNYSEKLVNDKTFRANEGTASNALSLAQQAAGNADITFDGKYSSAKKAMGVAKTASTEAETNMKSIKRRANDQQTK